MAAAIRAHDGAIVKTIGDAVMAAFTDPANALDAALAIRDDIAAFNRHLAEETGAEGVVLLVKIGLHSGACIAVTLNDRLDYFGSAVNLAARRLSESAGGDIVLSETMVAEPGIAERLAVLDARIETARVKGFAEPVALRRIPAGMFGTWMSLEPAVAAMIGLVLLGEALVARQWLAIGLVVIACAGAARGSAGRDQPAPDGPAPPPGG